MRDFLGSIIIVFILTGCGLTESDDQKFEDFEPIRNLVSYDVANNGDASDIRVVFENPNQESGTAALLIIPADTDFSNLTTLLLEGRKHWHKFTAETGIDGETAAPTTMDNQGNRITDGNSYRVIVAFQTAEEQFSATISEPVTITNENIQDLYVSNSRLSQIEVFDGVTHEHIKTLIRSGDSGLRDTQDLFFDSEGNLIVSAFFSSDLKKFNGLTGEFLGDFSSGFNLDRATKMSVGPDNRIYVSQWAEGDNAVIRFDLKTGKFVDKFIEQGGSPMDHWWDAEGSMYMVYFRDRVIRKYNPEGEQFESILNGSLSGPVNIFQNDEKNWFVVEFEAGSLSKFTEDFGFIERVVTGLGRVEGWLLDGKGNIYLCDYRNGSLHKYNLETGEKILQFGNEANLVSPNAIIYGQNIPVED